MATQKTTTPKKKQGVISDETLNNYISIKDAQNLINNFITSKKAQGKMAKVKSSPCFIGIYDLHQFMRVPNFEGINIHNGLTKEGEEVFVFTPITKVGKKLVEVKAFEVSVNGSTSSQTYIAYMAAKRPCPPPPPGYTECPQTFFSIEQ